MEDPNQILENKIPVSQPLRGAPKMFDINILPQRYRRRRLRLIAVLPWLIFILLFGALYQTGLLAMRAQGDFREKQYELTEIQTSLENYMEAADEKEALQAEVNARKEARDLILESYQGVDIQGSNLSDLFQMVEETIPPGIILTLLYQNDGQLHLEGEAETYDIVLNLLDALVLKDEFSEVYIDSATQVVDEEGGTSSIINDEGESVIVPDRFTFVIYATVVEEGLR